MSDFFDPARWGYCKWCAFQVAYDDFEEKLLPHASPTSTSCRGSNEPRTEQPGPEAKPWTYTPEEVMADALADETDEYD